MKVVVVGLVWQLLIFGLICFQIDRLWKDRLEHPIVNAEITKFMDKKWMVKEQTEINQS